MKLKLLSVLICSLALPVFAQTPVPATPTQVAVSGADKDKIELASCKLENIQLKAALTKDEANLQLIDLEKTATEMQSGYASKVEEIRVSLKIPANAQFDSKNFQFVIPPPPPVTTTAATPTK